MSRQTRRDQRLLDQQQRRAAANKRIGAQMAWWYYWEPKLLPTAGAVVVAATIWWVWANVDHDVIALVLGSAGVIALVAYGVWLARTGPTVRVMAAAHGRAINTAAWHCVGAAGVLLVAGAIVLARVSA